MPIIELKQIEHKEQFPGYHVRFIHSDTMTFAHWNVDAGAPLPQHSHPHEQVTHVLDGKFELTIDGETTVMEAGMVGIIPSNVTHSGCAITACRILDVFNPVREDYR